MAKLVRALIAEFGFNQSQAMKIVWHAAKHQEQIETEVLRQMAIGFCTFVFQKVDGTLRQTTATKNLAIVPTVADPKGTSKKNGSIVPFVEQASAGTDFQWRCFSRGSLLVILPNLPKQL